MIKTSFSTLACPHWDLSQVLQVAVDCGYQGVELRVLSGELDLWKLSDFQPRSLAATRRQVEDADIHIPCVDSSACFHSPDTVERQYNFDAALRMAELAAGLG